MTKYLLLGLAAVALVHGEPSPIRACAILTALADDGAGPPRDTGRIQDALNLCSPEMAVVLEAAAGHAAFVSGPLRIPRGVTLFVSKGVTLYASRNGHDFDIAPAICGDVEPNHPLTCRPLLFAYQAAFSAVRGNGMIDGQGVVRELLSTYESQGFALEGVTLRNASRIEVAIYKTIGLSLNDVRIQSSAPGIGILLSNALNANLNAPAIKVPGDAIHLTGSILGPTNNVRLRDATIAQGPGITRGKDVAVFQNECTHGTATPDRGCAGVPEIETAYAVDRSSVMSPGLKRTLTVSATGKADFPSVQKAMDALPVTGGDIIVQPGTYREVVTIRKPHVHLRGSDPDPAKTTIVYNNGALTHGGTFNTATVFVEADDVSIDHLSLVNDLGSGKGQGVALHVTGDRATFRNLRIVGAQDTLFAASKFCYGDYGPCEVARQYFADCFIEGNVDFIFGDSKAIFERCELRANPIGNVMFTAQSKHTASQESGYVFDHCHITGDARSGGVISLGRPWRPYSSVVFLNTRIDAPVIAAGWTEWARFGVDSLPTAYYAEFQSTGPGASTEGRNKYARTLSASEAATWDLKHFLAPPDGWIPAK